MPVIEWIKPTRTGMLGALSDQTLLQRCAGISPAQAASMDPGDLQDVLAGCRQQHTTAIGQMRGARNTAKKRHDAGMLSINAANAEMGAVASLLDALQCEQVVDVLDSAEAELERVVGDVEFIVSRINELGGLVGATFNDPEATAILADMEGMASQLTDLNDDTHATLSDLRITAADCARIRAQERAQEQPPSQPPVQPPPPASKPKKKGKSAAGIFLLGAAALAAIGLALKGGGGGGLPT